MTEGSVAHLTSAGVLRVVFGINAWVLVEDDAGRSDQRQVRSRRELARLLGGFALPPDEAASTADALWSSRPRDAADASADPDEAPWRGLKTWHVVVVLAVLVALLVYAALDLANVFPWPGERDPEPNPI